MKKTEWIVTYFDLGHDIISSEVVQASSQEKAQEIASVRVPENCDDWEISLKA